MRKSILILAICILPLFIFFLFFINFYPFRSRARYITSNGNMRIRINYDRMHQIRRNAGNVDDAKWELPVVWISPSYRLYLHPRVSRLSRSCVTSFCAPPRHCSPSPSRTYNPLTTSFVCRCLGRGLAIVGLNILQYNYPLLLFLSSEILKEEAIEEEEELVLVEEEPLLHLARSKCHHHTPTITVTLAATYKFIFILLNLPFFCFLTLTLKVFKVCVRLQNF